MMALISFGSSLGLSKSTKAWKAERNARLFRPTPAENWITDASNGETGDERGPVTLKNIGVVS